MRVLLKKFTVVNFYSDQLSEEALFIYRRNRTFRAREADELDNQSSLTLIWREREGGGGKN
ncbi:hypothetical protein SAMN05216206_0116 [Pseudomonas guineae]|uniref:Uncharacterized protein n=1 Tax=Pseudomonas guineae TaxID=425504 RepID=A0A1I3CKZ1_9PSED|nr:hypothetical protein SAMN05216206_0116 [Pseudomonas guineae]